MSYVPFREDPQFDALPNLKLVQSIASVFELLPLDFWVAFSKDAKFVPALAIVTFAALGHIEIKTKSTRELVLDMYEHMLQDLFAKTGLTPRDLIAAKEAAKKGPKPRFDQNRN